MEILVESKPDMNLYQGEASESTNHPSHSSMKTIFEGLAVSEELWMVILERVVILSSLVHIRAIYRVSTGLMAVVHCIVSYWQMVWSKG